MFDSAEEPPFSKMKLLPVDLGFDRWDKEMFKVFRKMFFREVRRDDYAPRFALRHLVSSRSISEAFVPRRSISHPGVFQRNRRSTFGSGLRNGRRCDSVARVSVLIRGTTSAGAFDRLPSQAIGTPPERTALGPSHREFTLCHGTPYP